MRKKLLLMFFALLGTVGAWAVQTKTYYVTRPNGTTTNQNGQVTGVNGVTNWGNKFVSEDNVLTFEMSIDKINWGFTTSQGFRINAGDLTTILTCTLSVPENHKIISYTFGVSPVNGDANNKGKIDYSKDSNMGNAILLEKESATTEHNEEVGAQTATFYLRHHEAFPVDVTLSVVVELPDDAHYNELLSQVEAINYGSGLGQYSLTGAYEGKTKDEVIAEAQQFADNKNYEEAENTLQAMLDATKLNMPAAGMFLRLMGKNKKYLTYGNVDSNGGKQYKYTDAEDATTIFYFDGTHLISLSSGRTVDMTDTNDASTGWDWVYGTAGTSEVIFSEGSLSGQYYVNIGRDDKNAYLRDDNTADRVKRAKNASANNGFDWTLTNIEELPITLNDIDYATLCSPVALTIPSGVTAYVATGIEVTTINLASISSTIPANVPVILEGAAGETYNFSIATGGSNPDTNILTATGLGVASIEARSVYTLQNIDGVPGFYTYTGTQLPAFKAYLPATDANRVKGFTFDFGTTDGIATVEGAVAEGSVIYNLAGQRVEKAVKGVYIVNGKKVLVK